MTKIVYDIVNYVFIYVVTKMGQDLETIFKVVIYYKECGLDGTPSSNKDN